MLHQPRNTDTHEKVMCIIAEDLICHIMQLLKYKKGSTFILQLPLFFLFCIFGTRQSLTSQCKCTIPSQFIKVDLSAKLKSYTNTFPDVNTIKSLFTALHSEYIHCVLFKSDFLQVQKLIYFHNEISKLHPIKSMTKVRWIMLSPAPQVLWNEHRP